MGELDEDYKELMALGRLIMKSKLTFEQRIAIDKIIQIALRQMGMKDELRQAIEARKKKEVTLKLYKMKVKHQVQ